MDICINTEQGNAEIEEVINLVCNAGLDAEIGYLKINPERVPGIYLEEDAYRAIRRFDNHMITLTLQGGRYFLITDDRAVTLEAEGLVHLYGNAFIVRKQKDQYTGLTMRELNEVMTMIADMQGSEESPFILLKTGQGGGN